MRGDRFHCRVLSWRAADSLHLTARFHPVSLSARCQRAVKHVRGRSLNTSGAYKRERRCFYLVLGGWSYGNNRDLATRDLGPGIPNLNTIDVILTMSS